MKRFVCLFLIMMLLPLAALADLGDGDERKFALRNGERDQPRICITMDDNYDTSFTRQAFEMAKQYDIPITFFVLGYALQEEDADFWREVADSKCEIGNHTNVHKKLGNMDQATIIKDVMTCQQKLDSILGYHYGMTSMRPPYGNITDKNNSNGKVARAIRKTGVYWHATLWDIASTDAYTCLKKVKNGSILLFHAKKPDISCLTQIIPKLIDRGYEFVTTSEMLDYPPVTRSEEPYVFDAALYQ